METIILLILERTMDKKLFGIAALFDTPDKIINAAHKTDSAGYKKFDVNTPYPVHGMDKAMGLKRSTLGYVTLFFGFSAAAFILLFMWWTLSRNYPMVIGGKPYFALPAFIPITFETTVLLGAISTFLGMIAVYFKLPANSHPIHDSAYMKAVSSDKYGLIIESEDPLFDLSRTDSFIKSLNPVSTELIYYPEKEIYSLFQPKFILFLVMVALLVSISTYITLNKLMFITPFGWMSEQDKEIPQRRSIFFSDGFGMRKPVSGTVARGFIPYPYIGQTTPAAVLTNPLLTTEEVLALGKRKFLTFCSPCHGNTADGDSRLRGQFPNPPTLHSDKIRKYPDGMIYHIITNGQNAMPSYAPQVTREERWAIINYIRVLQRAKNANPSDLSAITKEPVKNAR
jgi:mono/diheme cytochrome c family protein